MNLTDHFTLEEMTFSQTAARLNIPNAPCGVTVNNLTRLCTLLEDVRTLLGRPITISSGYRSQALNQAIGGAKNSQHILGCAADFTVRGLSVDDIMEAIVDSDLQYDQVIKEFGRWIHISVTSIEGAIPRKQALIIDSKGTHVWLPRS